MGVVSLLPAKAVDAKSKMINATAIAADTNTWIILTLSIVRIVLAPWRGNKYMEAKKIAAKQVWT